MPEYFVDEMVTGPFKSFKHEHIFSEANGLTKMVDVFNYKSPLGVLGSFADVLFLKRYMANLLKERNRIIKQFAEDPALYKKVLPQYATGQSG